MENDFSFNIEKEFGIISTSKAGWQTKLSLVSWGGRDAKFDIRPWSPDSSKMGKGVTLSKEELKALKEILNSIDL